MAMYQLIADAILLLHLFFVLFVLFGGLLLWRWPRVAWLHLPAVAWAIIVEWMGWICPLTPWENYFRQLAGAETYQGDFITRYLPPALYPAGLTSQVQIGLGVFVLLLNAAVYWRWWWRRKY